MFLQGDIANRPNRLQGNPAFDRRALRLTVTNLLP